MRTCAGGFQRIRRSRTDPTPRYPDAIGADALRDVLEPVQASLVELSNSRQDAIGRIERVANEARWTARAPAHCTSAALKFMLALQPSDSEDRPSRLKAMVCRAFAASERYAGAFAQSADDAAQAAGDATAIGAAIDILIGTDDATPLRRFQDGDGPLQRGLEAVERYRSNGETREEAIGRWHAVAEAIDTLDHVRLTLERARDRLPGPRGMIEDDARLFFVLRLAEVFALAIAEPLYFAEGAGTQGLRKRSGTLWGDFVHAALDVTGLMGDDLLIDGLLRRLKSYGPTGMDFSHALSCLVASATDYLLEYGDLPSAGLENNYPLGRPAEAWGKSVR